MLAQEAVHPNPGGPMLRGGQIPPEAAPRIGQQTLVRFEQSGSHRVEMHVVARRPQIPVAAAFDQLGFIATAEDVSKELVPMIQPDRVGALQPGHSGHQIWVRCFEH
jgi:hypothetical protein